jgi:transposase-like protein
VVRYSEERKAAVLGKLMPPHNRSVEDVAREEGISVASLYLWRKQARAQGRLLPAAVDSPEGWSARDKFAAVVECAALNETELAEYCRSRGLYPEQIRAWRAACEQANDWAQASERERHETRRDSARRMKALEHELRRKERALAEAAALLTLSKKARAIWGEDEDA